MYQGLSEKLIYKLKSERFCNAREVIRNRQKTKKTNLKNK